MALGVLLAIPTLILTMIYIKFKVSYNVQSFDLCFKVFHTLNAVYPTDSEHIWLLIQWVIYNIKEKFDQQIPGVNRILAELDWWLLGTLFFTYLLISLLKDYFVLFVYCK